MRRNRLALRRIEVLGDPLHLGMLATPVRIGLKLRLLIATVQPRKPRRTRAVAASINAMARYARLGGTGIAPAERDDFAGGGKAVRSCTVDRTAAHDRDRGKQRDQKAIEHIHHIPEPPPHAVVPEV